MAILRRTDQGGSAIVFAVIGVVLSICLICAIYFVRQYGDQVRKEQAIAAYDQEQADKKEDEAKNTKNSSPIVIDEGTPDGNSADGAIISDSSELPITGVNLSVLSLFEIYILTVLMVGYIISIQNQKRSL